MNRSFRTLLVVLLGAGAVALAAACSSSSGSSPSAFGEACTVYSVSAPCTTGLLCRCALEVALPDGDCFCTYSCDSADTCPNDAGLCTPANDPSQPTEAAGLVCFSVTVDGGPL